MTIEVKLLKTKIALPDLDNLPPAAGSRVVFTGCVRNHDQGEAVSYLEYSAHPQAEIFLNKAVAAARLETGNPQVEQVIVLHRVGELHIGDIALLVVVDSAHRAEGFALSSAIVDQIKATVPIWKKQFFADGHYTWSNCP